MLIRPGTPDDLGGVAACAEAAFGKYVKRIGARPIPMDADWARQIAHGEVFVLEDEGVIAGYVVLRPARKVMELETIALLPDYQGKGHGRALISFAEQQASRAGLEAIELYTNAKMTENIELYTRLGYVETGRRVQYGYARVFFRKEIRPS